MSEAEFEDVSRAVWKPVLDPKNALMWAVKNKSPLRVYFHGTTKKNWNSIRKGGFHDLKWLVENQRMGNHFVMSPATAEYWAGKGFVFLVCRIPLRHQIPEKIFVTKWKKPANTQHFLQNVVVKHGYDGYVGRGEAIVWDPTSVIVIGTLNILL